MRSHPLLTLLQSTRQALAQLDHEALEQLAAQAESMQQGLLPEKIAPTIYREQQKLHGEQQKLAGLLTSTAAGLRLLHRLHGRDAAWLR